MGTAVSRSSLLVLNKSNGRERLEKKSMQEKRPHSSEVCLNNTTVSWGWVEVDWKQS